ncbi:MAG TPA: hypothetical protein VF288_04900 [Mycobacteriales bacterium]
MVASQDNRQLPVPLVLELEGAGGDDRHCEERDPSQPDAVFHATPACISYAPVVKNLAAAVASTMLASSFVCREAAMGTNREVPAASRSMPNAALRAVGEGACRNTSAVASHVPARIPTPVAATGSRARKPKIVAIS